MRTAKRKKNSSLVTAVSDEEKELYRLFHKGDEDAKRVLVGRSREWVTNLAKKFHSIFPTIGIDELIAEGYRGVLDAMQRFDPARRVKFSTYSWFWIVKNMKEYITNELSIVNMPRAAQSEIRKITQAINTEIKKGKDPSLEKISKKMNIDVDRIREALWDKRNFSYIASLDKSLDQSGDSQRLGDIVEDKADKKAHDFIDIREDRSKLAHLFKILSPVERQVIRWRFGFVHDGATLKEIGLKLGISGAKVKDIESIAMRKLKHQMHKQGD